MFIKIGQKECWDILFYSYISLKNVCACLREKTHSKVHSCLYYFPNWEKGSIQYGTTPLKSNSKWFPAGQTGYIFHSIWCFLVNLSKSHLHYFRFIMFLWRREVIAMLIQQLVFNTEIWTIDFEIFFFKINTCQKLFKK